MQPDFMFTSESVTRGHPDKLCDQVSDSIVGHFLRLDPLSQLVAECAVSTGIVFIAVKYESEATVNVAAIARDMIRRVGYGDRAFNADSCTVLTNLHEFIQPRPRWKPEAELDDASLGEITAKEQATVFGFACTHTPALLPLPISLAHGLVRRLDDVRAEGDLAYLAPDGKTQVGVEFRNQRPHRIHSVTVVASQQEARFPEPKQLRDDLIQSVIEPVFREEPIAPDDRTRIAINPEGVFLGGGPAAHAGLTGRKTAVDTYGEFARHSGSALSGKDPSRIDRVGAYAARYAAKNVVAAGLADMCEVQLSYSLGFAGPVSVQVETYGTGTIPEHEIAARVERAFDFRLAAIIRDLRLRELPSEHKSGFYRKLAAYGHVGRPELELPWEATDRVDALG